MTQRSVIFDTETTGLDPAAGHRVLEIAAIELINDLPTGRHFHTLLDPEREVPAEATRVHGFTTSDVAGKPRFAEIAEALLDFFGDGPLIAHNAPFDFAFLDAELERIGRPPLDRGRMIDTLALAKERFPGLPNSLDALCRRFEIDLSERTRHNALLDCRLLAEVYLALTGGRQRDLGLAPASSLRPLRLLGERVPRTHTPRRITVSEAERAAHEAFLERLTDPLWRKLAEELSSG
jgi:DNA polymerase-3 subunit epsilon